MDGDVVDEGNLHRQIGHTEWRRGANKAASLAEAVHALNSRVDCIVHRERLTPANAAAVISGYDVVLDCTDNPATRYLINDACLLAGRPLVSGAAIGCDGQLSVYGLRDAAGPADSGDRAAEGRRGPCYRCVHPEPPAAVSSCADVGVLGPVTGVIGSMQALEAIKVATMLRDGGGGGGVFGETLSGR
jgi:adenylyltransferase/sulfurtransferase